MHRSRIILAIAAVISAAALLLPFIRLTTSGSVNGFDGFAWPPVVILLLLAVIALLGDRAESLRPAVALGAIGLAGVAVVLAAFKLADAIRASDGASATIGAGPWVLIGACVLGMAGALASLTRRI